jgi:membrane dipeptidase
MRIQLLILLTVFAACKSPTEKKVEVLSLAAIHKGAILVDTHNDVLLQTMEKGAIMDQDLTGITHSDLDRFKKGGGRCAILFGLV